ncbi:MAG: fibronectin type III domain-containing protein [Jatrophihabitans sp.]
MTPPVRPTSATRIRFRHAVPRRLAVLGCALALVAGGLVAESATAGALVPAVAPIGGINTITPYAYGVTVTGWAGDPDTRSPINVSLTVDGITRWTIAAKLPRADVARVYPRLGANHGFSGTSRIVSGTHRICLVAHNVGTGPKTKTLACRTIVQKDSPWGYLDSATSTSNVLRVKGWAFDYDKTTTPLQVRITSDGKTIVTTTANRSRPDVARVYGSYALLHGYDVSVKIPYGKHTVCAIAKNVGGGSDTTLRSCKQVNASAVAPSAPMSVKAAVSSTSATVTWAPPVANGGSTVMTYTVSSTPSGLTAKVTASMRTATLTKLVPQRKYTFTVRATNAIGTSAASKASNTITGPPPAIGAVTTPALVSTSRYIRNIHGKPTDVAITKKMGATDASYNPSNRRYLVLLDIGGQTSTLIGLSATSIYITYPQLVTALKGYIDGYASTQKYNAPAMIAVGVNNDIDVRALTGKIWAQQVINPLVAYAKKYPNITIAGANDMEPGFIGTAAQTRDWLSGYLAATSAKFVFNGSADGCNWTAVNGKCNNGWKAADLQWLAGGAAPTRIINLPQIYNTTMAKQWKYISLTGVVGHKAKINFGGPLTEWTACYSQHGGCGSITNNSAWSALWVQLRSDSRISQSSLPYGTDLRIN